MDNLTSDPEIRSAATDHLVKALLATLATKEPAIIDQVRDVLTIATVYDSPVAADREAVWTEIQRELQAVEDLVNGPTEDDADPDTLQLDGQLMDGALHTGL
jgi:hypothetical protein